MKSHYPGCMSDETCICQDYDNQLEYETETHLSNRPQDGRICQCEDAPCCGCYEL